MTGLALGCRLSAASRAQSLPARVKRILRKYPSAMVLPGPAVPILGPDVLQGKGEFASAVGWTLSPGATVADGKLTIVSAGENQWAQPYESLLVAGKTYAYSGVATVTSGSLILADHSNGVQYAATSAINASGSFSGVFTALSSQFQIKRGGATNVSIDNFYIREVLGYQNTYSSFIAGNYRESTGQNLAAVDQQVGLVVDAAQSLGPELVSNGGFDTADGWTLGSGWGVADGLCVGNTSAYAFIGYSLALGTKTYVIEFDITSYTSGLVQLQLAGGTAVSGMQHSSTGKKRQVITAIGNTAIRLQAGPAGFVGSIDNISVRELPGIHASHATSGFQPYLRQVPKTVGQERTIYAHPTWAAAGGSYTKSAPAWGGVGGSGLAVGKTYRMSFTVSAVTAGSSLGVYRRNAANSDNELVATINVVAGGSYSVAVPVVTDAATYDIWVDNNTFAGTLTNFSVSEVLEWTYALQFDGGDDRMSFSAVPFGTSDDFVMISGCRPAAALDMTIIGLGNSGQTNPAIVLGTLPSGQPRMWARNDAGTFVQVQGPSSIVGSDAVLAGRKKGSVMELRVNGVAAPTAAWPANSMAINTATLGALTRTTVGGFFSGHMHPQIMINGAPSDAEIGVLERFIARWQGRNL